MTPFDHPEFDCHEKILFATDQHSGLRAIIAVHSTALGPAVGGCRMWPYSTAQEAVTDVLRLSRAMSYKNAIAGLPLGGGKAVIIGDSTKDKSDALFDAFAEVVMTMGGQYVTAEDVGITATDLQRVANVCPFVSGLHASLAHGGGDPAPKTAYGVYLSIKAAVQFALGRESLRDLRIGIQGIGAVGMELAALLHGDGASLMVADRAPERTALAADRYGATVIRNEDLLSSPVDVLAPCALGAVLTDATIPTLQTEIVCGAANNQLGVQEDGEKLRTRGILYVPDYVANAGGIISVASEYLKHLSAQETLDRIRSIPRTVTEILARSKAECRATSEIADEMARSIVYPTQRVRKLDQSAAAARRAVTHA